MVCKLIKFPDSYFENLLQEKNKMKTIDIKNDYETFKGFVSQYPKVLEIAKKYKKNPGDLVNFFVSLGEEILNRSIDEIFINVSPKIEKIIGEKKFHFSDDTINALDNLITYLKANNRK